MPSTQKDDKQNYSSSYAEELQSDAIMSFVGYMREASRIGLNPRKTISFEELFNVAKSHCLSTYKYCDLDLYDKD